MRPFFLKRIILLLLISCFFFLFGNHLFTITDPDEAFYALTAKEMLAKNEWLIPHIFGQPQFEKSIFTYWLIEIAFKFFGESSFTARLFPAIFACLGVMAVYVLGLMGFKDERKAFLSAAVLASSAFFIAMGKIVFTDMIFSVFILLAMVMFMFGFIHRRQQGIGFVGFYVFCALATLTKGPLGFLIPQTVVILFLLYQRQLSFLRSWWVISGVLVYLAIALPWYMYACRLYGQDFIREFFYNDHWRRVLIAEHKDNDTWFFYPFAMFVGVFPWSFFLLAALVDLFKRLKSPVSMMDYLGLSWIIAVLIIFQPAHSKLSSYILPLFPALALIVGNFLGNGLSQIQDHRKIRKLLSVSFFALLILGVAVMIGQKLYVNYLSSILPVYFLSGSLIALSGIGFTLILKERLQLAVYLLILSLFPMLLTAFMVRSDVEKYLSSYEASKFVPSSSWQTTTVLTSKINARGIHYHTGQKVAVVDYIEQPYFSPHPIPILHTTDKIKGVLASQRVTFAIVRRTAYRNILENCADQYHVKLLGIVGFNHILRIEAK